MKRQMLILSTITLCLMGCGSKDKQSDEQAAQEQEQQQQLTVNLRDPMQAITDAEQTIADESADSENISLATPSVATDTVKADDSVYIHGLHQELTADPSLVTEVEPQTVEASTEIDEETVSELRLSSRQSELSQSEDISGAQVEAQHGDFLDFDAMPVPVKLSHSRPAAKRQKPAAQPLSKQTSQEKMPGSTTQRSILGDRKLTQQYRADIEQMRSKLRGEFASLKQNKAS